jgi:translation initiation factor 2 subunit 2
MDEKRYTNLLERAYSKIPPMVSKIDRFEILSPNSAVIGNRTIIQNFRDVCDRIHRDQQHLLRFLSKELATAGTIEGSHAIFQGKFLSSLLERLVERYVNEFVLCPVCHQPDTKITREGRFHFLVCDACGAKSSCRAL